MKQPEPEARRVATALELYCTGSLNLFNHPTNVKTDSRVVCIVLKNMGENLRKIAMHITNEFVSQAVDTNFREGVATWCYFDEFHVLLRDPLTASYFVAVWKMLRKKGCVPSALTQNVKDLLASREIENILDNTDFMILLSQAQSDRVILAKQLGISEHQLSYITHSNSGEGLLFYGKVYNLKQMAAALQYLKEHKLTDYEELAASTEAAVDRFHALAGELRETEAALSHTVQLMGATVDFAKTRPVFDGYKAARYSRKYLAQHEAELAAYRAAKAAMNDLLSGAKLPKIDALKKERRELSEKKKALYAEYRQAQRDMREAVAVKANIDHLLGLTDGRTDKEQTR